MAEWLSYGVKDPGIGLHHSATGSVPEGFGPLSSEWHRSCILGLEAAVSEDVSRSGGMQES